MLHNTIVHFLRSVFTLRSVLDHNTFVHVYVYKATRNAE